MNLRETIEQDLGETLEAEYGLPVILTSSNGVRQSKSANDPTADLVGQILYDTTMYDEGVEIIVHKPVVTLRVSSLVRVPVPGERWLVEIPTTPNYTATKESFLLERPSEDGGSIGFIRLYLMRAEQAA